MFVFTRRYLESRLANDLIVDSSKIKEIRTWLLQRKLHFQAIVRIWFKELVKSSNDKKLAFMYLAYDVIWHSIKDCPEFVTEFGMYMEKVFQHLVTVNFDEKAVNNIGEFIKIWGKRQIFVEEIQDAVEKIWKERSVDDITVVKEIKKEKGCADELPPHLTCSVCSDLLKEPVQLPCCKTALCKLCAFAKLERHSTCWFEFCPKSVMLGCKEKVNLSLELAIQVDLWKAQNKERFKENGVVADLEAMKNVDQESSCKSACTNTRAKADTLYSNILSAVAPGNLLKSHNNPYIVNDSASDVSQINNNEGIILNGERNSNTGCLLKWINPTRGKEQCTMSGKDTPMRDAMKRRLQCDDGTKSKICKQSVNGNHEASGMFKIPDAVNVKENTVVNTKGTASTASDDLSQINNNEGIIRNGERNSNTGGLLKWINPTRRKEQCTVSGKDTPMRDAMKRRLQCDDEGTKSKICKQNGDDNYEVSGMFNISDAVNVKENTLVNTKGTASIAKHSCNDHWLCERNSNAGCLLKWINTTGENEQSSVPGMKKRLQCDVKGTKSEMCKQNVNDNQEVSEILIISDTANIKENKHPVVVVKPKPFNILAPDVGSNGFPTPKPGCFECELCGITTTNNVELKKHLQGAKHKKKLSAGCFRCQLCGIATINNAELEKHLQGAKHKKNLGQAEEKWRHGVNESVGNQKGMLAATLTSSFPEKMVVVNETFTNLQDINVITLV